MGLKQWLARTTSSPAGYADAFSSGLLDLAQHLAASLTDFSGEQMSNAACNVSFESTFEMELAGFKSAALAALAAPSLHEVAQERLLNRAFHASVAFLSLYSENVARDVMQPVNADQFSKRLHFAIATAVAGRFGFNTEPRAAFETIQQLVPTFLCKRILNEDSFGTDDGLSNILNYLSRSADGTTRFAFVVGSKKQPVGCAAPCVGVITDIRENIRRCAADMRW